MQLKKVTHVQNCCFASVSDAVLHSTPSSRVTIVVALRKYYKGFYGDLSNRYSGVKNNDMNTSELLTLSLCLNLWCFLSIFVSLISRRFQGVLVLPLFVTYITSCKLS